MLNCKRRVWQGGNYRYVYQTAYWDEWPLFVALPALAPRPIIFFAHHAGRTIEAPVWQDDLDVLYDVMYGHRDRYGLGTPPEWTPWEAPAMPERRVWEEIRRTMPRVLKTNDPRPLLDWIAEESDSLIGWFLADPPRAYKTLTGEDYERPEEAEEVLDEVAAGSR